MKFLIVEPSILPILIPPRSKYSPKDPVFKCYQPAIIPYCDHVSQLFSTTGTTECFNWKCRQFTRNSNCHELYAKVTFMIIIIDLIAYCMAWPSQIYSSNPLYIPPTFSVQKFPMILGSYTRSFSNVFIKKIT